MPKPTLTRAQQTVTLLSSALPDHALSRRRALPMNTVYVFVAQVWCPVKLALHPVVKVGITNSVPRRLREIATHSPVPCELAFSVELPGEVEARYIEWEVHERRKQDRLHGEWFAMPPEDAIKIIEYLAPPPYPDWIYR